MIKDNSFVFTLSDSVKVGLGGDFIESNELTLHAPRMIDFNLVSKMIPIVTENFLKFSKTLGGETSQSSNSEEDMSDEDLEKAIEMSLYSCEKLDVLADFFKTLILKKGICFFDEQVQMKEGYLNNLNQDDYISLICKYCGRFIFPKQMLKSMS